MGEWPVKMGGVHESLTDVEVRGLTTISYGGSGEPENNNKQTNE